MKTPVINDKCYAGILLAAIGDALGWPYENPRRISNLEELQPGYFHNWFRRMGSRGITMKTLEPLEKGNYSDDTQMTLMTLRSLLSQNENAHFIKELIYFLHYQRGGGRSVKSSAKAYLENSTPWFHESCKNYFTARSNGGMMRQFPIVIQHRNDTSLESLLFHIAHHGLLTHGHPEAVIGTMIIGLLQFYALHKSKETTFLEYIDYIEEQDALWSTLPIDAFPKDFHQQYKKIIGQNYELTWQNTVTEYMTTLFKLKDDLIHQTDIRTILSKFHIHNRNRGYGISTVLSVLYYLEYYYKNPIEGFIACTTNSSIDCDTSASILGSILGARYGSSIIAEHWNEVQDYLYMKQLVSYLLADNPNELYTKSIEKELENQSHLSWISTPIEPAITEPASILATYKTTQTYRQPYKTVLGQTYYVVYREKL